MFVPFWQDPWPWSGLAVRTTLDPNSISKNVRDAVAQSLPGYSLTEIETMQESIDSQMSSDRFSMVLLAGSLLMTSVIKKDHRLRLVKTPQELHAFLLMARHPRINTDPRHVWLRAAMRSTIENLEG